VATDGASHAGESDAFVPFRVVQMLKYAEEFVGVLYIKPHTIIANKVYDLTLVLPTRLTALSWEHAYLPTVSRSGR
jgi:hypothetical protein